MKRIIYLLASTMSFCVLVGCGSRDPWYEHEDWWNYCSNGNALTKAIKKDIGKEVNLTLNGIAQKVRLIDVDKDLDKKDKKIHNTFEFVDLISDEEGDSIATQWDDIAEGGQANYLNSSIRKALTNEGLGHILWAQKKQSSWSEKYDGKTVLDMMPNGIKKVIKAPKKNVQYYENETWFEKPIINGKGEYDKLFLLSPEEMGSKEDRLGAYAYYHETDETKLMQSRIKRQVNMEGVVNFSTFMDDDSQVYKGYIYNYAGFNSSREDFGSYYWLRSPSENKGDFAWNIYSDGDLMDDRINSYVQGVAPAFCI